MGADGLGVYFGGVCGCGKTGIGLGGSVPFGADRLD